MQYNTVDISGTSLSNHHLAVVTNQTYDTQNKHKKPKQLNLTKVIKLNYPFFSCLLRHMSKKIVVNQIIISSFNSDVTSKVTVKIQTMHLSKFSVLLTVHRMCS